MYIVDFIKGVFIGIALVIPGLSGSMLAVATGVYEKILSAVADFREDVAGSLALLVPVGLGCILGILLSANIVMWVMVRYPGQSYMFFLGLVLGSLPVIIKKAGKIQFRPVYLIISACAFMGVMLLSKLSTGGNNDFVAISSIRSIKDVLIVAYAGIVSCSLMVVPGVSGSVLLMSINQYGSIYNAVGNCSKLISFLVQKDMAGAMSSVKGLAVLVPFVIGAAAGFILITKAVAHLIKKYEAFVYYGVGGFILSAAALLILEGILPYTPGMLHAGAAYWVTGAACVLGGFFCSSLFQ